MAYDISDLAQLIDIREGALNRNAQRKKDYCLLQKWSAISDCNGYTDQK